MQYNFIIKNNKGDFIVKDFKLGVLLESFQLPVKEAIKSAEKIGADGVQIYGSW